MSHPGSHPPSETGSQVPIHSRQNSHHDGWDDYTAGQAEAPPRTYATLETSAEPNRKTLHDRPPTWNGEHAERDLKPYLKQLSLWFKTTETPKKRQGLAIMAFAEGKLKQVIDALEEDEIADE